VTTAHQQGEYLSARNPIATETQRSVEAQALEIMELPAMVRARERATDRLLLLCRDSGIPTEVAHRLDITMLEWAFHYVLMALNSDANNPKIVRNYWEPEHEWFGLSVPGNRTFGGENWDNTYTVLPVDQYGTFELRGQRMDLPVADVSFSIMANIGVALTLDSIALQELDVAENGSFVITISPEPAKRVNGRRNNHLQTKLGACYLLIRDTRSDWRQVPNAYTIERLSKPLAPPLTIEQMIDYAVQWTVEDVASNHWFMVTPTTPPANVMPKPFNTGAIGGLVSQGIIQAHFKIADDEAYVITLPSGGSKVQVLTLYDYWMCAMDWRPTTSLNTSQSAPNPDGTYTYVLSHTDPGIHNWIDTTGVHDPRIMNRWHAMPVVPGSDSSLWVRGELVKLRDLEKALPPGTPEITPRGRRQQLAEREASFPLRYVDH